MVGAVGASGNAGWGAAGHRRVEPASSADRGRRHQQGSREGQGRALVPLPTRTEPARQHYHGANAAFLAHLIATEAGVPQTRARRRAEPEPSAKAYASAAGSTFYVRPGSILNRCA